MTTLTAEKACRDMAREIVAEKYRVTDEIWKRRIRYGTVAPYYDVITIKEINRRMPNLIVKTGGVPLDELADEYGFESTCDLIDLLAGYENKAVTFEKYYSHLLAEYEDGTADVPF